MSDTEKSFLRAILAGEPGASEMFAGWLDAQPGRKDDAKGWRIYRRPLTEAWREILDAHGEGITRNPAFAARYNQDAGYFQALVDEYTAIAGDLVRAVPHPTEPGRSAIMVGDAWTAFISTTPDENLA